MASVRDSRAGQGTYIRKNGDRYNGEFLDGERHCFGEMRYADGELLDGERQGFGEMRYADGEIRRGRFEHNKFIG